MICTVSVQKSVEVEALTLLFKVSLPIIVSQCSSFRSFSDLTFEDTSLWFSTYEEQTSQILIVMNPEGLGCVHK